MQSAFRGIRVFAAGMPMSKALFGLIETNDASGMPNLMFPEGLSYADDNEASFIKYRMN